MFGRKKNTERSGVTTLPPYEYKRDGTLVTPVYAEGTKVIESYWVTRGLARVSIIRNENYEYVYYTHEPILTDFEAALLNRLHPGVRDLLILKEIVVGERYQALYEAIDVLIEEYHLPEEVQPSSIYKIRYYLERSFFGWGRVDILRGDYDIEDISCDGYDRPVYLYHRKYRDMRTTIRFTDPHELDSLVVLFTQKSGKHISLANPIVDATLPDGSRIQLTYGTVVSDHGSTFTIRKFRRNPYSPIDLILTGTFTISEMVYLWMAVQYNHSVLIVGGTASGKTTTLNAMSQFIPALSKVVTIEDTREITLSHENWIPSIVPPSTGRGGDSSHDITMFDLLTAAMRQRPEYILVGEVRGVETQTMFQAINTGHTTFSTFHAGDVVTAINRLQNPPLDVPKATIESLDVVVSQSRMFKEGRSIRRCNEIVEIVGLTDVGDLEINTVYTYHADTDSPTYSGFSDVYSDIGVKTNMSSVQMQEELRHRHSILEQMIAQDIRDYRDVGDILWAYLSQPDEVLRHLSDLTQILPSRRRTMEEFKNEKVGKDQIRQETGNDPGMAGGSKDDETVPAAVPEHKWRWRRKRGKKERGNEMGEPTAPSVSSVPLRPVVPVSHDEKAVSFDIGDGYDSEAWEPVLTTVPQELIRSDEKEREEVSSVSSAVSSPSIEVDSSVDSVGPSPVSSPSLEIDSPVDSVGPSAVSSPSLEIDSSVASVGPSAVSSPSIEVDSSVASVGPSAVSSPSIEIDSPVDSVGPSAVSSPSETLSPSSEESHAATFPPSVEEHVSLYDSGEEELKAESPDDNEEDSLIEINSPPPSDEERYGRVSVDPEDALFEIETPIPADTRRYGYSDLAEHKQEDARTAKSGR